MGSNVSHHLKDKAARVVKRRDSARSVPLSPSSTKQAGLRATPATATPPDEGTVSTVDDSVPVAESRAAIGREQAPDNPPNESIGTVHLLDPSTIMVSQPTTVPCQYRTGRTLGSGTYAIVKEAIHIKTGQYYACKVINKKLMEGREHMVRNEIAVLKRISSGHANIVTLHDYFETSHNLYLCFDLCTGGELFDSICARGQYTEADAAGLVRTIFGAVQYIHDCGIVHRDLKPENLLFRNKGDNVEDIMIADFGLSRVMEENKLHQLTEICGTPGYMAPEIFKKTGHSKPVDIWAMGVITYFLLAGYTPFDRDSQRQEMEAIIAGDYRFEPEEYWSNVSPTARAFISECLTIDPMARPTAADCLAHPWLTADSPHFVESESGGPRDLLPQFRRAFDARRTFRKAVLGMMAMKRMSTLRHHLSPEAQKLGEDVYNYKQESEKEVMEHTHVIHHHNEHHGENGDDRAEKEGLQRISDISAEGESEEKLVNPHPRTEGQPLTPGGTGEVADKLAAVDLKAKNV